MIQSAQNPKIQRIRALLTKHKERQEQNCFVLEGLRLIEEAMQTGAQPELLLYGDVPTRAMQLIEKAKAHGTEIEEVKPSILESVSDTKTSQELIGIFKIPILPIPTQLDFAILLDGISDPGNMGTILRTATAAGVQLAILTPGTVDAFAPKVVRSAMGAHFYLPIRQMDWAEIHLLKQKANPKLNFLASDMAGGKSCWQSQLQKPIVIMIGNEANGLSSQARELADEQIHIPMQGKIESLNASTATSILLFEVIRQRTA